MTTLSSDFNSIDSLRNRYQTILPRIQTHAQIVFRGVMCARTKADCIAEAVALGWKWFVRLSQRGKDATKFPSALARLTARAVISGRTATRQERTRDVFSPIAQRRAGFGIERLPISTRTAMDELYAVPDGQRQLDAWEERLWDNREIPIPDQVNFRLSFPQFLGGLSDRDQKMVHFLSLGNSGKEAARLFKVTPAADHATPPTMVAIVVCDARRRELIGEFAPRVSWHTRCQLCAAACQRPRYVASKPSAYLK
jgi:hypothetical protein